MPPLPPAGVFDIRFTSGRRAENINNDFKTIMLNGVIYPVKVGAENMDIWLQDVTGKTINVNVKKGEEITISNTDIEELKVLGQLTPGRYALMQNFPNPFNPNTTIQFDIPSVTLQQTQSDIMVSLKVYDVLGNEIATLVNEKKPAGSYSVEFDGSKFSSGVYFYQLRTGEFVQTKKMILLR